jgi:hypothetical protein
MVRVLSLLGGVITFSMRAISSMESLTDTAASANLIVASSLGLFTGGFLNVPVHPPSRTDTRSIRTILLLIQGSFYFRSISLIETGGALIVKGYSSRFLEFFKEAVDYLSCLF